MFKYLPLLLFAAPAFAQQPAPAAPPAVGTPPAYTAGKICDVTYAVETETSDHYKVGGGLITMKAVPWVDVEDNHKKQMRVLDTLSKQQDKGGEYQVTVTETNTCEDGVTVRIADGSAYVIGVTLDGTVKVIDTALQVGKEVNDRYRARAAKGAKVGWDHSKALKVKRDDLGRELPYGKQ